MFVFDTGNISQTTLSLGKARVVHSLLLANCEMFFFHIFSLCYFVTCSNLCFVLV